MYQTSITLYAEFRIRVTIGFSSCRKKITSKNNSRNQKTTSKWNWIKQKSVFLLRSESKSVHIECWIKMVLELQYFTNLRPRWNFFLNADCYVNTWRWMTWLCTVCSSVHVIDTRASVITSLHSRHSTHTLWNCVEFVEYALWFLIRGIYVQFSIVTWICIFLWDSIAYQGIQVNSFYFAFYFSSFFFYPFNSIFSTVFIAAFYRFPCL